LERRQRHVDDGCIDEGQARPDDRCHERPLPRGWHGSLRLETQAADTAPGGAAKSV
jgi:hypothetical protein